jgi:hypothetical protein
MVTRWITSNGSAGLSRKSLNGKYFEGAGRLTGDDIIPHYMPMCIYVPMILLRLPDRNNGPDVLKLRNIYI